MRKTAEPKPVTDWSTPAITDAAVMTAYTMYVPPLAAHYASDYTPCVFSRQEIINPLAHRWDFL